MKITTIKGKELWVAFHYADKYFENRKYSECFIYDNYEAYKDRFKFGYINKSSYIARGSHEKKCDNSFYYSADTKLFVTNKWIKVRERKEALNIALSMLRQNLDINNWDERIHHEKQINEQIKTKYTEPPKKEKKIFDKSTLKKN